MYFNQTEPILYSGANGGEWVNVDRAVFEDLSISKEWRKTIRTVLIEGTVNSF